MDLVHLPRFGGRLSSGLKNETSTHFLSRQRVLVGDRPGAKSRPSPGDDIKEKLKWKSSGTEWSGSGKQSRLLVKDNCVNSTGPYLK